MHSMRKIWIGLFIALILLGNLWIGFWCWFFKDGLGPNTIESHGITALSRFFEDFWAIPVISLVIIFGFLKLLRYK